MGNGGTMDRPDHSTYREWLNLEADGALAPEQRAPLERHLASCPECRAERAELAALEGLLRQSRIEIRPDFKHSVLSALPATGWEARHPRTWHFPAAVFFLLGGIAVALLVTNSSDLGAQSSGWGSLTAVAGMFWAAVQAGGGFLGASWHGLALIAGEVFSSPVSLGAFGFLVLCLNLLLFSLLRRKRPARSELPADLPAGEGREGL